MGDTNDILSYPPPPRKQKFGIYRKSPCPSVCPSVHIVSRSYLLTHLSDLDNISHNCCPLPTGVSWPWPKVISSRLKSQCAHIQNPVGPVLRTAMLDLDNISHNRIMTFTQGHIAKVKVASISEILVFHASKLRYDWKIVIYLSRLVFVKHGCTGGKQIKIWQNSLSPTFWPSPTQGQVMSVKWEELIDKLTVQVWWLYHHPNFKYCTL